MQDHRRYALTLARQWRRASCYEAQRGELVSNRRVMFVILATHLLMLSIRSILVIPSQCRISGIRAWKRMSLTPAMFSVRLK